jgi:hypothetical protein
MSTSGFVTQSQFESLVSKLETQSVAHRRLENRVLELEEELHACQQALRVERSQTGELLHAVTRQLQEWTLEGLGLARSSCFFSLLTTLSDHRSAVVQDAWERIRKESFERTRAEEDASCDDIAELAKCTQAQLNNIARECTDSVFRLRSSMSGDVDVLRREVEAVQGQMDALKQDLASQLHELSAAAVTPGILAAAIAAMEKHANQYLPARSIILHSPAAGLLIALPGLKPASSVA